MALAATAGEVNFSQKRREVLVNLAFDSSYPTGGESLTAAQVGLSVIEYMNVLGGGNGYHYQYDTTNSKVKVYSTAATEVANTTDLSALTAVKAVFIGR